MANFAFDPRLPYASTLPSSYYTRPEALQNEYERVFARSWQLVGHVSAIPQPGSYFTTAIAREPLLIIRGRDGVMRALSNVCRHRAGPVAAGSGTKKVLQCGYHGWSYSLEGRLLGTPELEGIQCFERDSVRLPEFRIEAWNDLLFVSLDPAVPSLESVFEQVTRGVRGRQFEGYQPAARKEWDIRCNWKVYVDNYLEGYHIPVVHPSLYRELDYENYRTETALYSSIQHSPIRRPERLRAGADGSEAQFFWVFPNLMLNVYPDNFSTNLILPLGPDRTLTIFEWFFPSTSGQDDVSQTIGFSDEIQLEDIAICESVQKGLESRTYDSGRYSPVRENGVHHFHGLLAECLGIPRTGQ